MSLTEQYSSAQDQKQFQKGPAVSHSFGTFQHIFSPAIAEEDFSDMHLYWSDPELYTQKAKCHLRFEPSCLPVHDLWYLQV